MTANESFDRYMASLSPQERVAKSRDIREIMGISPFTLSDWRRGRVRLGMEKFLKIKRILGVELEADFDI